MPDEVARELREVAHLAGQLVSGQRAAACVAEVLQGRRGAAGSAGTTKATARCPTRGSARPAMATSSTAGCSRRAASTSAGHTVLAAGDDGVLQPPGDPAADRRADRAAVAGPEPPVVGEGRGGRVRVAPVAAHEGRAGQLDLPVRRRAHAAPASGDAVVDDAARSTRSGRTSAPGDAPAAARSASGGGRPAPPTTIASVPAEVRRRADQPVQHGGDERQVRDVRGSAATALGIEARRGRPTGGPARSARSRTSRPPMCAGGMHASHGPVPIRSAATATAAGDRVPGELHELGLPACRSWRRPGRCRRSTRLAAVRGSGSGRSARRMGGPGPSQERIPPGAARRGSTGSSAAPDSPAARAIPARPGRAAPRRRPGRPAPARPRLLPRSIG